MYIVVFDDRMGLHLDKRFLVVGILFVLLSTLFATQYATTKVSFQYAIVHPSNADIRFIGSDNSSDDGLRVLRISGDNGTNAKIGLEFGDWSANMNTTYTAAFCIVNEEPFALNITHVTVTNTSGTNDYMQVWLHGNGSLLAENDPTSVFMYNNGSALKTSSSVSWQFAKGDGDVSTMHPDISDNATKISTVWDGTEHVQYTLNLSGANDDAFPVGSSGRTLNNASDFVWVQISINVPAGAVGDAHTGTIEVHFQASSHLQSAASGGGGGQTSQYHVYIVNDVNAQAYEGETATNGGFNDGSENEFTAGDYTIISTNDSDNVYDSCSTVGKYQYHRFAFSITESVDSITRIDVVWKGYGFKPFGGGYGHSLWVKESGTWTLKDSGTSSSAEILDSSYTSGFSSIISSGQFIIGAQCDKSALGGEPAKTSNLFSYYAEVNVTYTASPFLYTFNNTNYTKFSDFIPRATTPEKEYVQYLDITKKAAVVDGIVSLKITEELPETTYLDRLYLQVDDNNIVELQRIIPCGMQGLSDGVFHGVTDVLLLRHSDDRYLQLNQGDEYILEFAVPENSSKIDFVSEGYYIKHIT